jgi:hypothetical protein
MNRLLRSIVLLFAGSAIVWQVNGCKHDPAPPTEADAIAVWKHTHKDVNTQQLLGLTKTNGQIEEVNGKKVYTFYYQAKVKDIVQLGNRPPGTVESYESNYPFQWNEKGWMGPDDQIYPEH